MIRSQAKWLPTIGETLLQVDSPGVCAALDWQQRGD